MAYNFDSDFYPMMVRVEAGPGIIVDFGENSDYEGVFRVNIDSDYIVNLIQEHSSGGAGSGFDSDQIRSMVEENSLFTDSDLTTFNDLRADIDKLRLDADSDSIRIQDLQEQVNNLQVLLDSDQVELLDIVRRLDSDMIAIEHLKRNADSDALRIRQLVAALDSDGRLLEKVIQNEEDIAKLRSDLDSESAEIRFLRRDIDSDLFDLNDVLRRLDSDEIAIQHITTRLKVVEDDFDSEEGYTRDRITVLRTRLSRLEDSDYFDSDRIVRTINLNRVGGSDLDSDSLYTSITKETDSHVTRIAALEKLLGVGAFAGTINAAPAAVTSDSDLIKLDYVQTGSTISEDTTFKWAIRGLGGGEIVSEEFIIAADSAFETLIRYIILRVNSNSLAMQYIDKMYIDLDSGLAADDSIHFRFKDQFTDMTFSAEVVETFDNGSFVQKKI